MEPDERRTIRAGKDGLIRFWGSDLEDLLGHTADQAIGSTIGTIIPPSLRPWHWRGFDQAIQRGELKKPGATVKVPALRRDGKIVAVRAELTLTHDAQGNVDGAAATGLRPDPPWVAVAWRPVLGVLTGVGAVQRLINRKRS